MTGTPHPLLSDPLLSPFLRRRPSGTGPPSRSAARRAAADGPTRGAPRRPLPSTRTGPGGPVPSRSATTAGGPSGWSAASPTSARRGGAPDPPAGSGECGDVLPAAGRRGESRPRDADPVRLGHPARMGGPRAEGAVGVLGFHTRVVASRVGPSPGSGHLLACAGGLLAAASRSVQLVSARLLARP